MLLDLVSKREMIFPPGTSAMLWLNDDLILTSISREPQFQFCIIDADDLSRTDLQMLNMHECNVDELRELLKGNEIVAQVPSWGVVALAPDFEASRMGYYISCRPCKEEDFKELLKDINYVTLKSSMYYWRDGEKIFSPNGQFYALMSGRGTPDKRLGIYYSKSEELLTEVHRRDYPIPLGLGLRMWGWAYDNSGVFFQITRYPELYYIPGPLYKLPAQPTETEARVWPFIAWLTVLLVGTGLVGAFAVRRKRRLSPNADD